MNQIPDLNHDFLPEDGPIVFLNGNHSNRSYLAVGSKAEVILDSEVNAFDQLQLFLDQHSDWVFGYLSYDLKNGLENLGSNNIDHLSFPLAHFFIPETLIEVSNNTPQLIYGDSNLLKVFQNNNTPESTKGIKLKARVNKDEYLNAVDTIKDHIHKGDIYETNYCYEFYNDNALISPQEIYPRLNQLTEAPFSCYAQFGDRFILSASPERFITKIGNKISSQPIKGTAKRGNSPQEDQELIDYLVSNQKERSENIMIVDLVRNDLSRIAVKGSVRVEELCKIYSFETVHQMISTVSCQVDDNTNISAILKATFPMGSMTGAPKIRAMELMEKYETTKRGVYSGAVGYITPERDFDFNVIIRTLLYNRTNHYLSCMVGSAITAKSNAEDEHTETLIKAEAMLKALNP